MPESFVFKYYIEMKHAEAKQVNKQLNKDIYIEAALLCFITLSAQ